MRLNFKEIIEGWRNLLIPPKEMKVLIENVAQERRAICNTCPYNSSNAKKDGYITIRMDEHCIKCGCPLASKTTALSSSCPLGFWTALTNEDERYEIEKQIKNEGTKLQEEDNRSSEEPDGGIS